jgi:hypothetical protein
MAVFTKTYTFTAGAKVKASEANQNFNDISTFLNNSVVHVDASKAFTGVPLGPSTDPTVDNHLARKLYVDQRVKIDGTTAFTGIPSGPATNPTTDNQLTRKKYVDDLVGTSKVSLPSPVAPSVTAANPQLRIGNVVGTTDVNGEVAFSFQTAFPTACLGVCITIGDVGAGAMVAGVKTLTASGFTAAIWTPTVVAVISGGNGVSRQASSAVRLNYIAIGY